MPTGPEGADGLSQEEMMSMNISRAQSDKELVDGGAKASLDSRGNVTEMKDLTGEQLDVAKSEMFEAKYMPYHNRLDQINGEKNMFKYNSMQSDALRDKFSSIWGQMKQARRNNDLSVLEGVGPMLDEYRQMVESGEKLY